MYVPGRLASDVQTQTGQTAPTNLLAPPAITGSTNALMPSPTKLSQQQQQLQQFQQQTTNMGTLQRANSNVMACSVAERGVPEGAASAPAHDFVMTQQTTVQTSTETSAPGLSDPPQNPVYYAMNV